MTDNSEDTPPDNETMREVKRAKARKEAAEEKGGIGWKTAAGICRVCAITHLIR